MKKIEVFFKLKKKKMKYSLLVSLTIIEDIE